MRSSIPPNASTRTTARSRRRTRNRSATSRKWKDADARQSRAAAEDPWSCSFRGRPTTTATRPSKTISPFELNAPLIGSAKFRWAPFLDVYGITLHDVKFDTYIEKEADQNGFPIIKIGNWKPGEDSDEAWCVVGDRFVQRQRSGAGRRQDGHKDEGDEAEEAVDDEYEEEPEEGERAGRARKGRRARRASGAGQAQAQYGRRASR